MLLPKEAIMQKDPFPLIVGQQQAKEQLISSLLAQRHVLLLGSPGVGKTTLAKEVARLLPTIEKEGKQIKGIDRFVRVQGSPDLTVEDLLGDIDPIKALKFGPLSKEAFTPGKIFKADQGILFFDELNRAPEKLQNALLQVLQEGYATLGSYDVDFPTNFIFIATMNPDDGTTEKVSDVLLDRFDVVYMNYPESQEIEEKIVTQFGNHIVDVPPKLTSFIVNFIRVLRNDARLEKKPSVRATVGLYERAQAYAVMQGKKFPEVEDLKAIVVSVLAHRIALKPSMKYKNNPEQVIAQAFQEFAETEGKSYEEGESP